MFADAKGHAFFDDQEIRFDVREIVEQEFLGHRIDDDGGFRMTEEEFTDIGGVIRLHVVDDEIVELAFAKEEAKVVVESFANRTIDGIEQQGLIV